MRYAPDTVWHKDAIYMETIDDGMMMVCIRLRIYSQPAYLELNRIRQYEMCNIHYSI